MRVAFIGLGAMGFPMASRVAQRPDVELAVYDADPHRLDRAAGLGRRATSVADAVVGADAVLTMLPADAHVRQVVEAIAEERTDGLILMDLSTIHPETVVWAAERMGPGARVLSASCMKSVAAATSGTLTIFAAGEDQALATTDPLLRAMATEVVRFARLGQAKLMKLVNNQAVAQLNLVLAEAAVLAGRAGSSYRALADALASEGLGGWALENQFVRHTLADDLPTGLFSVRYMAKDVALAVGAAADLQMPRLLDGPALAALRGAESLGFGDHYHPAIIRWLEAIAGEEGAVEAGTAASPPAALVDLVRSAEQLIAEHAVGIAERSGVARPLAVAALDAASASTQALRRLAGAVSPPPSPIAAAADVDGVLDRARSLATSVAYPGLVIESLSDYVRACASAASELVPPRWAHA